MRIIHYFLFSYVLILCTGLAPGNNNQNQIKSADTTKDLRAALTGSWSSDCLKPYSPEQNPASSTQFKWVYTDGQAIFVYTYFSDPNCTQIWNELKFHYVYKIGSPSRPVPGAVDIDFKSMKTTARYTTDFGVAGSNQLNMSSPNTECRKAVYKTNVETDITACAAKAPGEATYNIFAIDTKWLWMGACSEDQVPCGKSSAARPKSVTGPFVRN